MTAFLQVTPDTKIATTAYPDGTGEVDVGGCRIVGRCSDLAAVGSAFAYVVSELAGEGQ